MTGQTVDVDAWLRGLGRRVRILRLTREMTQDDLATAAGMSRSFVSLIEKGTHGVDVVRLLRLAAAAAGGGTVYLTRFGRRVGAVVPADVAESLEGSEPDEEPGAGVRELLADAETRLGPVPPEIAEEVDRQWAAALATM